MNLSFQEEKLISEFEHFGYSFNLREKIILVERFLLIGQRFRISEKEIARHYFQFSRSEQIVTLEKVDEFEDGLFEKLGANLEDNIIVNTVSIF